MPLSMMLAAPQSPQATIEMTGSTNTAPMKLTVSSAGSALVHVRQSGEVTNRLEAQVSSRLFDDLQSIGSLKALPRTHCIKSASFGTSLFVEFNGEQSPDLNCPAPAGSKTALLKKDVEELMQATHATPRMARTAR